MSELPRFTPPSGADARALRSVLAEWYAESARDLPWRRTRDAYAIWISEAMLQQTRVEVVVDYWTRFLEQFPDVRTLAEADEERVLEAWSGLGYYRRARSLQAAARVMVAEFGGEFPRSREAALSLPGVGPYTAGAVLSIAYDLPVALVDGNVERVLSRVFGVDGTKGSPELLRCMWSAAEFLVERGTAKSDLVAPSVWSQALMELGALVCTPRAPKCAACPVRGHCAAFATDRAEELPRPKKRREPVDVALEVYVVREGDAVLLVRRPSTGRMARMWEFPTVEASDTGLFPTELPDWIGPRLEPGHELFEFGHGITHHRIRARVRAARAPRFRWFDDPEVGRVVVTLEDARRLALTGMARKVLDRLDSGADSLFA
ncbi:MAG: A/G-specific adenine glycosylase [Planctomycetota bacterium]